MAEEMNGSIETADPELNRLPAQERTLIHRADTSARSMQDFTSPEELYGELVAAIRNARDEFGLTVLLIEHDMKVIMSLCEYIYVMASGEVIASGTPDEIRGDPKVIAAYLGRQQNA